MSQNYVYPAGYSGVAPAGSATAANQVLEIAQLTAIDGKLPATLGQTTEAGSLSVTLASDQTLPLPTGASTSALQTTLNTTIAARLSGALVPTAYDEIALTYVPSGPGAGQIQTAVYKLATVTVKTLTLTYDGSDRLSDVVAS